MFYVMIATAGSQAGLWITGVSRQPLDYVSYLWVQLLAGGYKRLPAALWPDSAPGNQTVTL